MLALFILAQAATVQLPMPAFLAGCWEQRAGDRWADECWTGARGGVMVGSARTGQGETVTNWEWMRVERGADGGLTFTAAPRGAPASAFKATTANDREVIFVNAAHDYPQRVRYTRTATGIDAEVSLADGSKPMRWSYRRPGSPTAR